MSFSFVDNETQYQVRGPDGVILWRGGVILAGGYRIINAGAAFGIGHAIAPSASTTIAGAYNPGTSDALVTALYGVIAPATTPVGYIGVAMTPAAVSTATPTPTASVAGVGSILPVQMTAAAGALGDALIVSGTAGVCTTLAVGQAAPTVGKILGVCIKAGAALGTAATPAGYSGYVAGVLVCPS